MMSAGVVFSAFFLKPRGVRAESMSTEKKFLAIFK